MPEEGHHYNPNHLKPALYPHETFPLLDGVRLAELFPALEQLSLDARAVTGLPDLLAGMEMLEGLTLVNVRASNRFEKEMKALMWGVRVKWPRLRRVKMWPFRSAEGMEALTWRVGVQWPRLWRVKMWAMWLFRSAEGTGLHAVWDEDDFWEMFKRLGFSNVSEEESSRKVGAVVAGVSFLAASNVKEMKLFADE